MNSEFIFTAVTFFITIRLLSRFVGGLTVTSAVPRRSSTAPNKSIRCKIDPNVINSRIMPFSVQFTEPIYRYLTVIICDRGGYKTSTINIRDRVHFVAVAVPGASPAGADSGPPLAR